MSCCGCHAVRGAEGHWHHRARVGISWSGWQSKCYDPAPEFQKIFLQEHI